MNSNLSANMNHSNANGNGVGVVDGGAWQGGGGAEGKDIKIMTLKRKQKALKAELEKTICKTTSFQEAFQTELDLRTKLEEKYEALHVRYEVRVESIGLVDM